MSTQLNFNAATVDPSFSGGGKFLPVSKEKGWLVKLTADNGFKNASSGEGQYLELAGEGIEPEVQGMPFVIRLNLQHNKMAAMKAAQAQLSALAHVMGKLQVGSTAELMGIPFRIVSVLQNPQDPNGYTQLADNGILDANGNKPTFGQPSQAAQGGGQGVQMAGPGQAPQGQAPQGMQNPQAGQPQGGQAPQGDWGGQPQSQPQGQPQGGAPSWGGGQPQGDPNQNGQAAQGGAPSWGGGGAPSWGGQ